MVSRVAFAFFATVLAVYFVDYSFAKVSHTTEKNLGMTKIFTLGF